MKRSIGVIIGTLAAAVSLVACNNNSSTSPIPTPNGTNCGNPANNMEVLYPIPNGKAAPNVGGVVVAFDQTLPSGNQYDLWINQSNGSAQYTVNQNGAPVYGMGSGFYSISVSNIPNPHKNPTFANPVYYATNFTSPIGPAQAVNVYWNDAGLGCNPNVIVSSFRTK
jgi:hypothetical protein